MCGFVRSRRDPSLTVYAQSGGPINQKIGGFYASCMDEKAVDAAGAGALKTDLERIAALRTRQP